MRLSKSQKSKVSIALAQHEQFKNSYFWRNTGNAHNRRRLEEQNNFELKFINAGVEYRYISHLSVSCKNYYYRGEFYVNGMKKNVTAFKKLIN